MRMKRSSMCSISANVSAPCSKCGKLQEKAYPWPVHIIRDDHAPGSHPSTAYMCADCCPEHGRPPLLAA
jgi:hypothetical protein